MKALVLLVVGSGLWVVGAQSPFAFREAGAGRLELTENGKPVFVYNHGMMLPSGVPENRRRSSYLHPVYTPNGTVVTDDFPRDHYHHRGLFWTWPVVVVDGEKYDLWAIRGIHQKFVRWTAREAGPDQARLGVENGWFAGERKVVKETVEVVARPARGNARRLDLALTFEAVGRAVEIAGEPAQQKGYGGLSLRFGPRQETRIRTDAGLEAKDTNMAPHPWAELEGVFQGRRAGARIDIDPSNPDFPSGWCLRNYGFLGVNFPGLKPYRLEPGRPLVLRYWVTVFSR